MTHHYDRPESTSTAMSLGSRTRTERHHRAPAALKLVSLKSILAVATSLSLVVVAGCSSEPASRGEKSGSDGQTGAVSIKMSSIVPNTNTTAKKFMLPFINYAEETAKKQGHTLKIQLFPDAQLGKATAQIDLLNSGVTDIAAVSSSYNAPRMPLGNVFNLPRFADSARAAAGSYYRVLQNHNSAIYETDFAKNKIVPLAVWAQPPYEVVSKKPISGPSAFKGLLIRAAGGVQEDVVRAVGGTPVKLAPAEQYTGFQRGTVDAGLFNLPSILPNKVYEVTKTFTTNARITNFNGALAISQRAWDSLPKWAQKALQSAGKKATYDFAKFIDAANIKDISTLKKKGLTAVTFNSQQLNQLTAMLRPVKDEWLKSMSAKGLDGESALKEAKAALKAGD